MYIQLNLASKVLNLPKKLHFFVRFKWPDSYQIPEGNYRTIRVIDEGAGAAQLKNIDSALFQL